MQNGTDVSSETVSGRSEAASETASGRSEAASGNG